MPAGVSTKKRRGTASTLASIVPRASARRCSVVRATTSWTRESGRTSTCPMRPTAMSAREESSVCNQSPTCSRPDAARRFVPMSGRPASAVTSHALRSARAINRKTRTAAAASGTQYQRRCHEGEPARVPRRAWISGHRSRGGSMLLGRRLTASCSSCSFIAPTSPVTIAGRETAAPWMCPLRYRRAARSRRDRSLRCHTTRRPPALHPASPRWPARDRC